MNGRRNKANDLNSKKGKDEWGVINMAKVATGLRPSEMAAQKKLVNREPSDARDLRKMIGTRSVSGKNLVGIYKEGK